MYVVPSSPENGHRLSRIVWKRREMRVPQLAGTLFLVPVLTMFLLEIGQVLPHPPFSKQSAAAQRSMDNRALCWQLPHSWYHSSGHTIWEPPSAAVERIWHIKDSHGQILALPFRLKCSNPCKLLHIAPEAACAPFRRVCAADSIVRSTVPSSRPPLTQEPSRCDYTSAWRCRENT